MNKAIKVQITKCYLVQILDKDGNELACDYSFVSRQDAKEIGNRMKADYNADIEKGDTDER